MSDVHQGEREMSDKQKMTRKKPIKTRRRKRNVVDQHATIPMKRRCIYLLARVSLTLISLLLCLVVLEIVLRMGLLDQTTSEHPVWYPPHLKARDEEIDLANYRFARQNPYGFTDKIRTYTRPPGTKRLAVLGDSFVFGDGIPWTETWSHKLERLFNDDPDCNVEVIHWSRNGWSTAHEFSFLNTEGRKYELDALIVGWTANDPNIVLVESFDLTWQDAPHWSPVKWVLPYTFAFVSSGVNHIMCKYTTKYGYNNWLNRLYTEENLKYYRGVLHDLAQVARERNLPLVFVLTPNNHNERFRRYYDAVIPLFEELQIPYLDLYPAVKKELGHMPTRALCANPADGHPGKHLTELFARHTYAYAKEHFPLGMDTKE